MTQNRAGITARVDFSLVCTFVRLAQYILVIRVQLCAAFRSLDLDTRDEVASFGVKT